MKKKGKGSGIQFQVSAHNLYRDEAFTDLNSATIRKLTPIKLDQTEDTSRKPVFIGHAELISPQGPVPIQAQLPATNLEEAIAALPEAMEKAAHDFRDEYNKMMEQQKQQQEAQSKVIKSN